MTLSWREKETQKSPDNSLRDRLYLEIPGFSTNDLGESRERWFEARASFSAQELDLGEGGEPG